jgi:hypothetical protein
MLNAHEIPFPRFLLEIYFNLAISCDVDLAREESTDGAQKFADVMDFTQALVTASVG